MFDEPISSFKSPFTGGRMSQNILTLLVVVALAALHSPDALAQKSQDAKTKNRIAHGKYLVNLGGCEDCHSPKTFGPTGMHFDSTRTLSGHPAGSKIPDIPKGVLTPDGWSVLSNAHLTAWAGPWGISFARNLTPDVATGIGSWTEEIFIKAIRTGKDMGEGRDILPPMPWQNYSKLTDDDLKAIFAYLKSLKPIENPIPDPIPPPEH